MVEVKTVQVEVSENVSLLEPSRLMSCTQLVTSRLPRPFGRVPVDNFFLFLTTRCQTYKWSRETHVPLTFLKQGLLSDEVQRGEIAEWAGKVDLLMRTVTDITLRIFKWNPYICRLLVPGVELRTGGFNNLLKIHKINLCWRYYFLFMSVYHNEVFKIKKNLP